MRGHKKETAHTKTNRLIFDAIQHAFNKAATRDDCVNVTYAAREKFLNIIQDALPEKWEINGSTVSDDNVIEYVEAGVSFIPY